MTPKQEERIRNKIKKIKAELAADKRYWGGFYHDGGGLRYKPPQLYLQLGDYTGALRYFNWFDKNFPDDIGFPDLLMIWTIVLVNRGRRKEAEKKAFQTHRENTYLFDIFLGRPVVEPGERFLQFWETREAAEHYVQFADKVEDLSEFKAWLEAFISTEKFIHVHKKLIDIQLQFNKESNTEKRGRLSQLESDLENEF